MAPNSGAVAFRIAESPAWIDSAPHTRSRGRAGPSSAARRRGSPASGGAAPPASPRQTTSGSSSAPPATRSATSRDRTELARAEAHEEEEPPQCARARQFDEVAAPHRRTHASARPPGAAAPVCGRAAGIAGQRTVAADDAVAWHDHRGGLRPMAAPTARVACAAPSSQRSRRSSSSRRARCAPAPATPLERRAGFEVEREVQKPSRRPAEVVEELLACRVAQQRSSSSRGGTDERRDAPSGRRTTRRQGRACAISMGTERGVDARLRRCNEEKVGCAGVIIGSQAVPQHQGRRTNATAATRSSAAHARAPHPRSQFEGVERRRRQAEMRRSSRARASRRSAPSTPDPGHRLQPGDQRRGVCPGRKQGLDLQSMLRRARRRRRAAADDAELGEFGHVAPGRRARRREAAVEVVHGVASGAPKRPARRPPTCARRDRDLLAEHGAHGELERIDAAGRRARLGRRRAVEGGSR